MIFALSPRPRNITKAGIRWLCPLYVTLGAVIKHCDTVLGCRNHESLKTLHLTQPANTNTPLNFMDANGVWHGLMTPRKTTPVRVLVIGAGSRGFGYARALEASTNATVAAVAEPKEFQRNEFGRRYIWGSFPPSKGQEFPSWQDFVEHEKRRRELSKAHRDQVEQLIDAAFVCLLDEGHHEAVAALAPLNLHIMCEKPLSTSLSNCLDIYASLLPDGPKSEPSSIFGIGHVLRYSDHNALLRSLIWNDQVVGDLLSVEHTEPVGWWHFAHSYVRGNWRRENTSAPVLLTKSCHDIDLLIFFLTMPPGEGEPHLPSFISSTGLLSFFRRIRKPPEAGTATNCVTSCPVESSCPYSAKKIYIDRHLRNGITQWPVNVVNSEIEDIYNAKGAAAAEDQLLRTLSQDYDHSSDPQHVASRPWFGRCVWESDNDVLDDQVVTLTWEDADTAPSNCHKDKCSAKPARTAPRRLAKTATFHMIAHTEAQCERRGRIYGSKGEITYDSKMIRVYNFATGCSQIYNPKQGAGGHGGGDDGLTTQFILAVEAVKFGKMSVIEAQKRYIGCQLVDIIKSHAFVFAAEEARLQRKVVDWTSWWREIVEKNLLERRGWDIIGTPV